MAETMQDIRRRMRTIESTLHITHAMRLVSAAKLRTAKKRYDRIGSQLDEVMTRMEGLLAGSSAESTGPRLQYGQAVPQSGRRTPEGAGSETGSRLVILYTSSRGLCGGYNSSLLKTAAGLLSPDDVLCTVGSRGGEFFRRQGRTLLWAFPDGPEKISPEDAGTLANLVLQAWTSGQTCEVLLVNMNYVNTLKQEPGVHRLLPLEGADGADRRSDADGRDSGTEPTPSEVPAEDREFSNLEFHPSREQVLAALLPKYLQLTLWKAAAESAVCEHSARRAAMETASESADDMLAALSRSFNRVRQQAITDELIEIVSGAESLK